MMALLVLGLLLSCNLFGDPEPNDDDPNFTGTDFTETFSSNNEGVSIGDNGTYSVGTGERITYPEDYIPESFTVKVKNGYPFGSSGDTVTLELRIWDTVTYELLGSASEDIDGAYEDGNVVFTISDCNDIIPGGTNVFYAVFVSGALANDYQGQLLYSSSGDFYSSGYRLFSDPGLDDTEIDDFDSFYESTGGSAFFYENYRSDCKWI